MNSKWRPSSEEARPETVKRGMAAVHLSDARPGQRLRIKGIADDRARDQALRFGLAEGAEAVCEWVIPGGPVVLGRDTLRLAIGRRLADLITVEAISRDRRRRGGCS